MSQVLALFASSTRQSYPAILVTNILLTMLCFSTYTHVQELAEHIFRVFQTVYLFKIYNRVS